MFDNFKARHPVVFWVVAVGVVLIAVWALGSRLFGGSGTVSQSASTVETLGGPSDAAIAASASLEIARLQAQADAARRADELALAEEELGVNYQLSVLDHNRGMQADQLSYNLGIHQIDANTAQIGIAADVQRALAQLEAQTDQAQIAANRDMSLAVTNAQVQINQQNTSAQVAMNSNNNRTARRNSSNSLIGGIIGGITSLFSDARLKENIELSHIDAKTGLAWYRFNYSPWAQRRFGLPKARRLGVIAQDLLDTRYAHTVTRDNTGYYRVNYAAINGLAWGRLAVA